MNPYKTELRIPGPVPVPPAVLQAASHPMINHRGREFKDMYPRAMKRLQPIFGTQQPIYAVTGSGTAGMEAAAVNIVSPGDKVLVPVGGVFGLRWKSILDAYGADVQLLEYGWGEALDPDTVRSVLQANPDIKAVFTTHNESSTGVLNDIQALGQAAAGHQALLVVDAVSSLGGTPTEMDAWGLDVVCTASQKCLMVPPGLAFLAFSPAAMDRSQSVASSRFYFNINRYDEMLAKGETPFTPNISLIYGLEAALDMIEGEGLERVYARHRLMQTMVRAGVRALDLPLLVDEECASPTTTAVKPEGWDSVDSFRARVRVSMGIELAGGQGPFADRIFRIGHMGYAGPLDMVSCLAALEVALDRPGTAVAAAENVWKQSLLALEGR